MAWESDRLLRFNRNLIPRLHVRALVHDRSIYRLVSQDQQREREIVPRPVVVIFRVVIFRIWIPLKVSFVRGEWLSL
jgi:hypothetical protein